MTEPIANLSSDELGAIGLAVNGIRERTIASLEAYNGATEQSAEGVAAAE